MVEVRAARDAMNTRFEIVLFGEREAHLHAAAKEALDEISRLEAQLSYYRADSDVREINVYAAHRAVPVDARLFRLLEWSARLSAATDGAFDITVAPLMRCWGFVGGTGQMPEEQAIADARSVVGMQHVILDRANYTVRFDRQGVEIDLGSIGKGFAIEEAVELLRDNEIESALLHGGTSAVYAIGAPPGADAWQVAIQKPFAAEAEHLAVVPLRDMSLSVSAPHGKWFASGGKRYGHVIDPRTGYPTSRSLLAAIVMPAPTEGDALSTGLLTLGPDFLPRLASRAPEIRALVAVEDAQGEMQVYGQGISTGEASGK